MERKGELRKQSKCQERFFGLFFVFAFPFAYHGHPILSCLFYRICILHNHVYDSYPDRLSTMTSLVLLALTVFVVGVGANSNGPPLSACADLIPSGHPPSTGNKDPVPWDINVTPAVYQPGATLSGISNNKGCAKLHMNNA